MKRNVVNPAGWLIASLQANYSHPESQQKVDDERTINSVKVEQENKTVILKKYCLLEKEKKKRGFHPGEKV